ncbi:MAG: hypothetical protein QM811_13120 [Pirellulales bacterium]
MSLVALTGTQLVGCGSSEATLTVPERGFGDARDDSYEEAHRLLGALTFGPTHDDLQAVLDLGYDAWLRLQLTPDEIVENPVLLQKLARLETLELAPSDVRDQELPDENTIVVPFLRKTMGIKNPLEMEKPPGLTQPELQTASLLRGV